MIQQVLYKGFSVALAILVLMSTTSFTIKKHYCGETLVDTAIFSKAENCGIETPNMEKTSMKMKNCCKDEVTVVRGQDDLKVNTIEDFKFQVQQFLATFFYGYVSLFDWLPKQTIPHKDYSPPNLVLDIQALDQVFII